MATRKNAPSLYEALSHAPVREAGNKPDLTIYRSPGKPQFGRFQFEAPAEGLVQRNPPHGTETKWTREFEIAWTKWGDAGPLVLFLHGVPTNRAQWEPTQKEVARFCRTISIDMLAMGESTKPRLYGRKDKPNLNPGDNTQWYWPGDVHYIEKLMQHEFKGEKFFFVADDWGSGILSHYAAKHNDRLLGIAHLDPITFDGYPVNEIQAIGRASQIPDTPEGDQQFAMLFGAFDQTLVQIYKTMVYDPNVYNQYNLRWITFPYVDVDYERNRAGDGVSDVAKSTTLRLKLHPMRVLAERAAILSPALLLPHHPEKNPNGVKYQDTTVPALILWGEYDNMMPAAQTQRFAYVLGTDDVEIQYVPRAGHFAGTDNPLFVANAIVNFVRRAAGREKLADVNLGTQGIWKGDERLMIRDLRDIYGIDARPELER
ncbi:MAG: alpha/beta hydrolase [Gemmatimonadetes bacterium]|nr:alpha/beta hydrolase [Gemmatimonadota bacterium]